MVTILFEKNKNMRFNIQIFFNCLKRKVKKIFIFEFKERLSMQTINTSPPKDDK